MNITQVIESVADSLPILARNDLPMIRQALNDTVDAAVKEGQMTERQANSWNQDYAVRRVQRFLVVRGYYVCDVEE